MAKKKAHTVTTEDWVLPVVALVAFAMAFVALGIGTEAMEHDEPATLVRAHQLLAGALLVMAAACAWYRSRQPYVMSRRWPVGFAGVGLLAMVLGFSAPKVLGAVFQVIAAFL